MREALMPSGAHEARNSRHGFTASASIALIPSNEADTGSGGEKTSRRSGASKNDN
jgi:hypothetical protein